MKHLILIFSLTVVALTAAAQEPGTTPQPSLYEWFFPEEPAVQVEPSIGLKTKDSLADKFRRKADRMAVRWMRKAEKSREDAAKLIEEADALMKKAQGLRSEAVLKEKEALWFEAEKAKILGMKFK